MSNGPGVPLIVELIPHCTSTPRGGWYTLQFAAADLAVTAHNPVGIDFGPTAE